MTSGKKHDSEAGTADPADGDLEKMPVEAVLGKLETDAKKGLDSGEASRRQAQYGPNALPEKHVGMAEKILKYFVGPIAFMIEAAALVSAFLGRWDDFVIIFGLLVFNAGLELWQDMKASNALAALKKSLASQATVLRDGSYQSVDAAELVPGDIVKIRLGGTVPADMRLVTGDFASIDQAGPYRRISTGHREGG